MNYLKYIIGLGLITLLFNGCSEDLFTQIVEIDVPEHESGISIGADFWQTDTDVIRLQASKGIQETGPLENILNANVVLKQDGVVVKTYEDMSTSGATSEGYHINLEEIVLDVGESYTLEVEKEGFRKASSTQIMPDVVPITNVEYIPEGFVEPDGFRTDKISVTFTDPEEVKNYYGIQVKLFYVDFDGEERNFKLFIFNDIDPLLEGGYNQDIVFTDGAINGRSVTFDFSLGQRFSDGRDESRLQIELFNTTEDKYLHERSLRIYEDSGFNPFVEPVIVHENVEGGHGLFSLSNVSTFSIDID